MHAATPCRKGIFSGGAPKLRKGSGFPLLLRHRALLQRLQRGNRCNPSPAGATRYGLCGQVCTTKRPHML